ncbi:hypothetical protein D3C85_916800 [compost metagenome]
MTATRKVVWPTSGITLTAAGVARKASIQARKVPKRNSSAGPSRSSGCGMSVRDSGARLIPQLPVTTVVMPWDTLGSMSGCASR